MDRSDLMYKSHNMHTMYTLTYVPNGAVTLAQTLNDVMNRIVDSAYPFDPSDDSDVRVFLAEILDNEHDDLELARYELRERRTGVAQKLAEDLEKNSVAQVDSWIVTQV